MLRVATHEELPGRDGDHLGLEGLAGSAAGPVRLWGCHWCMCNGRSALPIRYPFSIFFWRSCSAIRGWLFIGGLFACKWWHGPYLAKLWFLNEGLIREAAIKGFVALFSMEVVVCYTTKHYRDIS
jgi:hypothetical protein